MSKPATLPVPTPPASGAPPSALPPALEAALDLLACPATGQALRVAAADTVAELNVRIARGGVRDVSGSRVSEPMEAGLVTADGHWLYAVRGGIAGLEAARAVRVGSPASDAG
ncbi:MAG: hypothetical protein EXR79_05075 [Myxococcales bacterium]|nr:hypothetical protein [Myxococcales bacterium]